MVERLQSKGTGTFDDAFARLGWVTKLCARALANRAVRDGERRPYFDVEEVVVRGARFLRLSYPPPPADLSFLIGDISVGAKSCLDMAVQAVVDTLDLGWRNPEFPLVDDREDPSNPPRCWADAKNKLRAVFWEAIAEVQPHQPNPAYGRWDMPATGAFASVWPAPSMPSVNSWVGPALMDFGFRVSLDRSLGPSDWAYCSARAGLGAELCPVLRLPVP